MDNLFRFVWCCFLSLTVLMPLLNCQRTDFTSTILFDTDTQKAANSTINCTNKDLLDIVSIQYKYHSTDCIQTCPKVPGSTYLVERSTICSNENNIRRSCYAKNSCSVDDNGPLVVRPSDLCGGGNNKATHISVTYRCVSPEYVFDLCDQRSISVNTDTQLIFTAPSAESVTGKISCSCVLRSTRGSGETLNTNLTFTRLRMAMFRFSDKLYWGNNLTRTVVSGQYNLGSLSPERTYNIGTTQIAPAVIEVQNSNELSGSSTAFVMVEPGKDLTVQCNGAPLETDNSEISSGVTVDTMTLSGSAKSITPQTVSVTSSSSTNSNRPSTATSAGVSDEDESRTNGIVIGLSVALVLIVIIVIAGILIFCFLRRRRKRRADKHAARMNANNNSELPLLQTGVMDPTYHELEQNENQYDVIKGEGEYSDYSKAKQSDETTVDPYKVTDLERDLANNDHFDRVRLTANEYATPENQLRNSQGSMDVYTDNSTTTDGIYSRPNDVMSGERAVQEVEYDVPADVYAVIKKPKPQVPEVEFVESKIYGT